MVDGAKIRGVALAALLSCAGSFVQAQGYPARPVRIIVPFAAGGGTVIEQSDPLDRTQCQGREIARQFLSVVGKEG